MKISCIAINCIILLLLSSCTTTFSPIYKPSADLGFEDLTKMPVKVQIIDDRPDEGKMFAKVGFIEYWDIDSSYCKKEQDLKLSQTTSAIFKQAFETGMKRYGYNVSDSSDVLIQIIVKKFFCDLSFKKKTMEIVFDIAVIKSPQVIYTSSLEVEGDVAHSAWYKDVENIMSKGLSKAVENQISNAEFVHAVKTAHVN